jgi:uncharacterized protein (DUF3084 family)
MTEKLEINLNQDSIVNEHTGEVQAPAEFVENLRGLERTIAAADREITALSADLSAARKARERAVAMLRGAVRDGKVLPLLELAGDAEKGWSDEELSK